MFEEKDLMEFGVHSHNRHITIKASDRQEMEKIYEVVEGDIEDSHHEEFEVYPEGEKLCLSSDDKVIETYPLDSIF